MNQNSSITPRPAKWFYEEVSDEVEWLWEPYLPLGAFAVFSAYMKVGKSTLFYSLAGAIDRGDPTFCGGAIKQTGVLVVAAEEHQRDISRHLKESGIGPDNSNLHVLFEAADTTQEKLDILYNFCRNNDKHLVIIDPITKFWRGVDDENDNAQVTQALAPLHALTRRSDYPLTILMIHHNNKAGDGFRAMRGASALYAQVDQAIMMTKSTELKNGRNLIFSGRYAETPQDIPILLELDDETGIYKRVDAEELEQKSVTAKVLEALGKGGRFTTDDIRDITGLSYRKLRKVLAKIEGVNREGAGTKGNPYFYSTQSAAKIVQQAEEGVDLGEVDAVGAPSAKS